MGRYNSAKSFVVALRESKVGPQNGDIGKVSYKRGHACLLQKKKEEKKGAGAVSGFISRVKTLDGDIRTRVIRDDFLRFVFPRIHTIGVITEWKYDLLVWISRFIDTIRRFRSWC